MKKHGTAASSAEVLRSFDEAIVAADGTRFTARACGRRREDELWEGWIEFVADNDRPTLRSARETLQPSRADLTYWAGGLRKPYLEGTLARAGEPPRSARIVPNGRPSYSSPAPSRARPLRAVLDPFALYAQSEDRLRQQLNALGPVQLRQIIRAYDLVGDRHRLTLETLSKSLLVHIIMDCVAEVEEHEITPPSGVAPGDTGITPGRAGGTA